LIAEDGYTAECSYSIASPPDGQRVELTVKKLPDGEVSTYVVGEMMVGDEVELRGPIGGWFVWHPEESRPILLFGGGSGVVPLMAMLRRRAKLGSVAPFSLLYSVHSPDDVFYADELSLYRARTRRTLGELRLGSAWTMPWWCSDWCIWRWFRFWVGWSC
jgi:ferredoxin-NADP reductase